jgi:hypothetical protein
MRMEDKVTRVLAIAAFLLVMALFAAQLSAFIVGGMNRLPYSRSMEGEKFR